ncbi:MAG TPA: hypothetical protein DDY14_08990 [Chromatiaceae bacterium]|nr:MAG: hypothetical protein N838_13045 [Thiohalocapsa sp. PB-PSB1]QQO54533.1 MAG: hypothetical protein N838_15485 [Thiohalocapsa sp. PB-PSB1]HBG95441.1 hypothetical protein [Chromatiaceae bacterium]HCS89495.1 hypothetical protein [Chromatiaceae bacterium]
MLQTKEYAMPPIFLLNSALAAVLLTGTTLARTAPIALPRLDYSLPVSLEIAAITLAGTGEIPLGTAEPGGYQFVDSAVELSEDSDRASTLSGNIDLSGDLTIDDATAELSGSVSISADLNYDLNFVLGLTNTDSLYDYADGVPLSMPMDATSGTVQQTWDLSFPIDPGVDMSNLLVGLEVSDLLTFKNSDMGVDINGNAENDFIEVMLTGFTSDIRLDLIEVDLINGSGTPSLAFAVESVSFSGNVGDVSTDPPFGPIFLTTVDDVFAAPIPSTLLLMPMGLLGFAFRRR